MAPNRAQTRTGGRPATRGTIPGRLALSVGMPNQPAPEGWRWTKLTDVARLETGHTPSRKRPEYWGGEIPWIGIKDATRNHGRKIYDTIQHTNELGIANSSARVLPANTVCLSRTASVGFVVIMGRPMATSQDFVNWVCSNKLDSQFLKYVLLAERSAFLRFASGTTHQTIYFPEVKAFHICLPPISTQHRIAHILGTLDDRIEVNRRMNETLEAMVRALFKSWFVDFDPVRAKMNDRDTGLPQDIADLFPDGMVNSEMGEIPDGWEVSQIGDEVDVVGGSTPSTKELSYWHQGDHYWATPKDLSKLSSPVLLDTTRKLTDAGLLKISSRTLPVGTVLLSSRAPIGYLAIAEIPTAVNQGFIAMKCERRLPNLYVLYWCEQNLGYIRDIAGGSTFAEISKKTFRTVSVIVPPQAILGEYQRLSQPLYDLLVANVKEAATLAPLRDTLLPRLLSAQIRVGEGTDAEAILKEVV